MILVLQTNVPGLISVWLVQDKKILIQKAMPVQWHGSDRALAVVDQTLQTKKVRLTSIQKIIVVRGPGSFTAVRTGLIVANTLSLILHIPVLGVVSKRQLTPEDVWRYASRSGKRQMVKPWYGKSPNITKPKLQRLQAKAKR